MPPINLLIKPASGLCNMKCRYCFYCDVQQNRAKADFGIMDYTTLETVVKKALSYASGHCTFGFQGGEPTLAGLEFFYTAVEMQKKYNVNKITVLNSLQTNGLAVDEKWATFFAENNFLIGLSVDGVKRTHDINRFDMAGNPTFSKIMERAELFDRLKVEYNILTVVNHQTAKEIKRIYSFYKKKGFRFLQFIPCLDPLGEKPGLCDYSLSSEVYGKFLCELFDLWYADLLEKRQPFIRMFENYISILLGKGAESCDMRGICSNQCVIEADGSVYPCDFYVLDEYRLGSIRSENFNDFMNRSYDFIDLSKNPPQGCTDCMYYPLCRGGCRRHRCRIDDAKTINIFCHAYKLFFAYSADRLTDIARKLRLYN